MSRGDAPTQPRALAGRVPVRSAARLMHEQKIGALPVIDDGRLVGILTESDVLAVLEEVFPCHVTTVRPLRDSAPGGVYDYGFPEPGEGEVEPETRTSGNPGVGVPVPRPSTCR